MSQQELVKYGLTFHFPTVNRSIQSVEQLQIEPLWEVDQEHYVGLYKIMVKLQFGERIDMQANEGAIEIEELDLQQNSGYFEYAFPFEGMGNVEAIQVVETKGLVQQQQLQVQWESAIDMKQVLEIVEAPPQPLKQIVKQQEKVKPILRETQQANVFLNDLVEQYSVWYSSDFGPQKERNNDEQQK